MPTIFTPPQVDPRRRPDRSGEPGDGDHGSGRRPPIDKRTGGNDNGDGDENWNDKPVGSRGPRERIDQYRVALGFSLSAILMFFIGLVTAFIVTKSNYHYDPHFQYITTPGGPPPVPHIVWFSTAVLLLSSVAAEFARRSMFRENDAMDEWIGLGRPISRRATLWLLHVTLRAFGIAFLCRASGRMAATRRATGLPPLRHQHQILLYLHCDSRDPSAPRTWAPSSSARHRPAQLRADSLLARSSSTPPSGTGTPWALSGYASSFFWNSSSEATLPKSPWAWHTIEHLFHYLGVGFGVACPETVECSFACASPQPFLLAFVRPWYPQPRAARSAETTCRPLHSPSSKPTVTPSNYSLFPASPFSRAACFCCAAIDRATS